MPTHPTPLNAQTFVVLGDGLSAGAGDFGLSEELQAFSFPALAARQIGTPFAQPLIEAPGIGPVVGFPELPVRLPQPMQTTVLTEFPPAGLFSNVSIPGLRLSDALGRRPVSPLIHRSDSLQTAINLIIGLPGLVLPGEQTLPTPVEYAQFRQPTLLLVALGVFDVVDAAVKADAAWLPDDVSFRLQYTSVLAPFGRVPSTRVVCTIPDPAHTAYFTRVADAARVVKADAGVLATLFGLLAHDYLTPAGLIEAGCRVITRTAEPLPEGSVVPAGVVARISERTASLNAQIRAVAKEQDALVLDLHALAVRLHQDGITVGGKHLTAGFLGGLYSLNGVSPGATGHGVIANELLALLNASCGTAFAPVNLEELAKADPVAEYRPAPGPLTTAAHLAESPLRAKAPRAAKAAAKAGEPRARITLPDSLKADLHVNAEASYFGDALRPAHTTVERDIPFGSSPNTLFGGLAIVQSHLHGTVKVTFSPPEGDIARFTLSMGKGLTGEDSVLASPQFFKLPNFKNQVTDVEGLVSAGELNLATGEVLNLNVKVAFGNSALDALVSVNPKIPPTPIEFSNETRQDKENPHYGSVWAKFEQRADGTLDFMMSGVSFLPLGAGFGGEPLRFPLPFAGPSMEFASIPAVSTALHPHLKLSTKPLDTAPRGARCPDIPVNTVREYTAFTHTTAFGDKFTMNIPEMEGGATGRAHLAGRVVIQFGERTGDTVPFAVSSLLPGGVFAKPPDSPMAKEFPGRMSVGFLGHDETLRFKKISYDMKGVAWVDDPFELSLGSIDLRTGQVIGDHLFRGFIVQDVLLTLLKLEPRTPKSSWHMRGPAAFEKDPNGQTVFGFSGQVRVEYPEGFGFPKPDLKSVYLAGPGSALDPYIYIQAMDGMAPPPSGKAGDAHGVMASNGQRFSYKYRIPGYPSGKPAMFEYVNEATGGKFQMGSLVWVSFGNANRPAPPGQCDVVTFTGIGLWSLDMTGPHMATVQISTAPDAPYVSIQIDGGLVSNVNTKPATAVLPFATPVHA